MSILQAILLGIIQGLSEFLPISSTAHLTLAGKAMNMIDPNQPQQWTAFIAVIQLGTLVSVIIYFWSDIVQIVSGFIRANLAASKKRAISTEDRQYALLGWMVLIGTLPAALIGLAFKHQIEGVFTKDLRVISWALILLAIALAVAELTARKVRDMSQLKMSDAIVVGVAQAFALIPGCSRSGSTITGGLFAGLTREAAARFSFLLSIPAIAASGILELPKALQSVHTGIAPLLVATVVSAISGYVCIAFLIRFLQRNSTFLFIIYRIVLGVVILALLWAGRVEP